MKKKKELPLTEPIYSTYHNQSAATAILATNPTIRHWYLNEVMMLSCTRKFLRGYTTPEADIAESSWASNPYIEQCWYSMRFLKGHVHYVIRNLLDNGYYVFFNGIDDYYVEGKSWYKTRHFNHDGTICGYDQENKTYSIYAYDNNWICQKFLTSQHSFKKGLQVMFEQNRFGSICGLKPKRDRVLFSSEKALKHIDDYLHSTTEEYSDQEDGLVYGIAVHDYIGKYVRKLYDESIPYEKMDPRVFRMIWEHKKFMLERIRHIETDLSLHSDIGDSYEAIVRDANAIRMLYASHHMKRRDSVLPIIERNLLSIKNREEQLLGEIVAYKKGENKI